MAIHQLEIGNMRNFIYLVESRGQAVVVDPQRDLTPWIKILEERGAKLVGCLLTHSHWDHVAGVAETVRRFNVPVWVHASDEHRLSKEPPLVLRSVHHLDPKVPIMVGGYMIEAIHTPGHSAGEVCLLVKEPGSESPAALLTGDTVFVGDVGRCDLETGDVAQMFETLQRLKQLPDDTIVYPGHNYGRTPTSTVGREKTESAAWRCSSVKELDALP